MIALRCSFNTLTANAGLVNNIVPVLKQLGAKASGQTWKDEAPSNSLDEFSKVWYCESPSAAVLAAYASSIPASMVSAEEE